MPIYSLWEPFAALRAWPRDGGPYERTTTQTVVGDVGVDPLQQLLHATERSAPNGRVGDEPNERST